MACAISFEMISFGAFLNLVNIMRILPREGEENQSTKKKEINTA